MGPFLAPFWFIREVGAVKDESIGLKGRRNPAQG